VNLRRILAAIATIATFANGRAKAWAAALGAFALLSTAILAIALALALALSGCGRNTEVAGGGTDTETGGGKAIGRVLLPGGGGADCAVVEARSRTFLKAILESVPSTQGVRRTEADAQGAFRLDSLAAGSYVFEAHCGDTLVAAAEGSIQDTGSRISLPVLALKRPGRVTGRVRYADGSRNGSLIRAYGLGHAVMADTSGTFSLSGLPEGIFTVSVSSLAPFQDSVDVAGVRVTADSATDIGEVVLGRKLKQGFEIVAGHVSIPGVGGDNPVIYDNDRFDNTADDDYLWALASLGRVDLRGTILPGRPGGSADSFQAYHRESFRELHAARASGLRNLPDPVQGASAPLHLPASGRWEDMQLEANPGSALIAAEAARSSPDKPLLVFAGGPMTTVAGAVLMDPTIADRMIVFGTFNLNRPDEDSLAVFVVAKRCRLIEWGRSYSWDTSLVKDSSLVPPGNRFAEGLWRKYLRASVPFAFFGDLSGLVFAYDGTVFRSGQSANLPSPGAKPILGAPAPYDFIDIPAGATDFPRIQADFFALLSDPAAYHPWPVPGRVQAEGYATHSAASGAAFPDAPGPVVDSGGEGGAEALHGLAAGAWAAWRVDGDSGPYHISMRCRMPGGGSLEVTAGGADPVRVDVAADSAWGTFTADIRLRAGVDTLRVAPVAGSLDLDWMQITRP